MHSLRHTLATRLMEAGTPVEQIADILGHQSVQSTGVYLNSRELHQTREKLQVAMSGRCSSGLSRVLGMAA
jgi:integrase